ncbi:MAG: AraC family transcriptional regulator [Verrucomicrobiota bacterium JB024]|nr:AraC family transcriptional regulator [Verrucomicrobiota bacterium JB024]
MGLVLYETSNLEAPLVSSDERVFVVPPRGRVTVQNREFKIVYFLRAQGRLFIDDEHVYDISDGSLVTFPGACRHLYENSSPDAPAQIHAFRLALKPREKIRTIRDERKRHFFQDNFAQPQMVSVLHAPDIIENINLIRREVEQKSPGWELSVNAAIWQFIVAAARAFQTVNQPAPKAVSTRFLLVNKAREYIHKNYHRPLTLGEIALYVDRGEEHLAREFKKMLGITVFQYLRQTRIEAAISLMADSAFSLTQIATLTGFSTLAFFSRCFREATGKSPSAYRAELASQLIMPEGQNRYEMY